MRKLSMQELQRLSVEEYQKIHNPNLVLVLDNLRSMHNIGSVFRSADAFGAAKIVLCGITATPPHREIQKTALGATESVAWEYAEHTAKALENLKEQGFCIVALEQTTQSKALHQVSFGAEQKYAFVFGNEVQGISQEALEFADWGVEIPQFGTKHSFNVAVSVGVVLWHYHYKAFLL